MAKKIRIDAKMEEEIISYLKEGKSREEISKLIGHSQGVISRLIKENNLSKYEFSWEKEKENIRRLYEKDKLSLKNIAKKFGVGEATISKVIKGFGFNRDPIVQKEIFKERQCPICGEFFIPKYKYQEYCSPKCRYTYLSQTKEKIAPKDRLLEKLIKTNWNYRKTSEFFGVSGTTIGRWIEKYNINNPKPKHKSWTDVIDLTSAQAKIDELGIQTVRGLQKNYGGLLNRLNTLGIKTYSLNFPGSNNEFDSSWEENMFNLIKDNISYTSLEHNIILDPECKFTFPLIFDIVIEYPNSSKVAIEIQGPTHFIQVYKNGSSLESVRKRDEIKYQYCLDHEIDLYYFTYDQSLVDTYGYPYPIYTDENLLLDKLKTYSS